MDWLTRFLFAHTRQTEPDGRPLYAYKMRDDTYTDLRIHFHQLILLDQQGKLSGRHAHCQNRRVADVHRRSG